MESDIANSFSDTYFNNLAQQIHNRPGYLEN